MVGQSLVVHCMALFLINQGSVSYTHLDVYKRQFHYDMKPKDQEVETDLKVGFSPLKETIENYPKEHSIVGARLEFRLVFDTYVLSGSVSQINHVLNRKIEGQSDVTQEEVDQLVAPLFAVSYTHLRSLRRSVHSNCLMKYKTSLAVVLQMQLPRFHNTSII